jgi:ubiquinone biosynthesis protein COQ4
MSDPTASQPSRTTPRPLAIPPAPPAPPVRLRLALRALRALLAAPDDTERAIDFMNALAPREVERSFQRLAASERGRALLAERPSLLAALADHDALARLPEASFGRSYLAYLERNGFEPGGLLALNLRVRARWEREGLLPPHDAWRAWFSERSILLHDVFHVLTDYGTDDLGEATLLVFSLAQTGGRAQALLTLGAAFDATRARGPRFLRSAWHAWRSGRHATALVTLPWEELLPLRLETVRRLAGMLTPAEAHPEGIPRGLVVQRSAG